MRLTLDGRRSGIRADIEEQGYTIVVKVGDSRLLPA